MLQYLPEELLERILSLFFHYLHLGDSTANRRGQETLAAICRVNKTLCRLARPLLYRACFLVDRHSLASFRTTPATTKPGNASLVRELRIQREKTRIPVKGVQHDASIAALQPSLERMLSDIFPEHDPTDSLQTELPKGLLHRYDTIEVAIALGLCLNLKVLILSTQLWEYSDLIPRILDALARHKGQKLSDLGLRRRRVSYLSDSDDSDSEDRDSDTLASNATSLPFLQTFRGSGMTMVEHLDSFAFTSIQAPLLSEVILRDSVVDEAAILRILMHCPLLGHLEIHRGDSPLIDEFGTDYRLMGDHLRQHGQRLRFLEFDIREAMYNEFNDFTDGLPALGSLAD